MEIWAFGDHWGTSLGDVFSRKIPPERDWTGGRTGNLGEEILGKSVCFLNVLVRRNPLLGEILGSGLGERLGRILHRRNPPEREKIGEVPGWMPG